MFFSGRTARRGWRSEILLASLVLSASVVCLQFAARALSSSAAGSFGQGIGDVAICLPVAALAAWAGLRLSSRFGLDQEGPGSALNQAALVSLIFTILMVPWAIVQG